VLKEFDFDVNSSGCVIGRGRGLHLVIARTIKTRNTEIVVVHGPMTRTLRTDIRRHGSVAGRGLMGGTWYRLWSGTWNQLWSGLAGREPCTDVLLIRSFCSRNLH